MKYRDYSARDFANDSFFIRWVKNPDEESNWFWNSFIKENTACAHEIETARELVDLVDFPSRQLTDNELSGMRNSLLIALRADKETDSKPVRRLEFMATAKPWLKLAAAVLIVPLISFGIFLLIDRVEDRFSILAENERGVEKRVNPIGQKSVLFLSDGTKVWLNAASKISYAKDFKDRGTRDVYLEGEAFFDVARNADKPFIVHTSSIKIKVLGTSFNVKSYSEEKTIETTLVHGKVRIEQSDVKGNRIGDLELKPNQRAVFNKKSKVIAIKEVVGDNTGSWKQERLVFDEETIDNVLLQMERWYNVKIHVGNRGNLDCKLTASIEKESLDEILRLVEASYNIRYTIEGSEVFIEGTLCETE